MKMQPYVLEEFLKSFGIYSGHIKKVSRGFIVLEPSCSVNIFTGYSSDTNWKDAKPLKKVKEGFLYLTPHTSKNSDTVQTAYPKSIYIHSNTVYALSKFIEEAKWYTLDVKVQNDPSLGFTTPRDIAFDLIDDLAEKSKILRVKRLGRQSYTEKGIKAHVMTFPNKVDEILSNLNNSDTSREYSFKYCLKSIR